MTEKNFFTDIKNLAIIIAIGAFANAIKEIIEERAADWFFSVFTKGMSIFGSYFIDFLHSDIGKGFDKQSIPHLGLIIYILLMFILFVPIYKVLSEKNKHSEKNPNVMEVSDEEIKEKQIQEKQNYIYKYINSSLAIIISIIGMVFVTSYFIKSSYHEKAVLFVERSIDILAPKLYKQDNGWDNILSLRAQYRAVDNAEKYNLLYQRLYKLSQQQEITLPYFQSLADFKKTTNNRLKTEN